MKIKILLSMVFVAIIFNACGGGGGGDSTETTIVKKESPAVIKTGNKKNDSDSYSYVEVETESSSEFSRIVGVYHDESYSDTNLTIQETINDNIIVVKANGKIDVLNVDVTNNCLVDVSESDINALLDNKQLEKKEESFTVNLIDNITSFSTYIETDLRVGFLIQEDGDKEWVFYQRTGDEEQIYVDYTGDLDVPFFLSLEKSKKYNINNVYNYKCTDVGTKYKYENIKGIYQDSTIVDANITIQNMIRNSVVQIDENGTMNAYNYHSGNDCLDPADTLGEINYVLHGNSLDNIWIGSVSDEPLKQYYYEDTEGIWYGYYETLDGNNTIKYISYETADIVLASSDRSFAATDLNASLTTVISTKYDENNISSSICP